MKKLIIILPVLILVSFLSSNNYLRAEDGKDISKGTVETLNSQLYKEIQNELLKPISICFCNKFVQGNVDVIMTVDDEGKIIISGIKGDNGTLERMINEKIHSLNLWTDTKYSGASFSYKIKCKQKAKS